MKSGITFLLSLGFAGTALADKPNYRPNTSETALPATYSSSPGPISRVNIQAGASISTLEGDISGENKTYTKGFIGGLTTDIGHGDVVFETGLLYRQGGAAWTYRGADMTYTVNYLTLPLLAKVYLLDSNSADANMFLRGGLLPSFLVSQKLEAKRGEDSVTLTDLEAADSFDLPATVGAGVLLRMAERADLVISGDYLRSIKRMDKSKFTNEAYNSAFSLMASASLRF